MDDRIVLKSPRERGSEKFAQEIKIFDTFEEHTPCPNIVQSFLRVPEGNFWLFSAAGLWSSGYKRTRSGMVLVAAAKSSKYPRRSLSIWLNSG
jgi:hypothetical protein